MEWSNHWSSPASLIPPTVGVTGGDTTDVSDEGAHHGKRDESCDHAILPSEMHPASPTTWAHDLPVQCFSPDTRVVTVAWLLMITAGARNPAVLRQVGPIVICSAWRRPYFVRPIEGTTIAARLARPEVVRIREDRRHVIIGILAPAVVAQDLAVANVRHNVIRFHDRRSVAASRAALIHVHSPYSRSEFRQ
jgi:hypothetical protein